MTELSDRLFYQLHKARARNLRATLMDIDAVGVAELPIPAPVTDAGTVDRFVQQHIEGALCWRDPAATSPDLQARARI